jgi:hypothetical protein
MKDGLVVKSPDFFHQELIGPEARKNDAAAAGSKIDRNMPAGIHAESRPYRRPARPSRYSGKKTV